jgi:GTP-binding protein EngB required for normal cell division
MVQSARNESVVGLATVNRTASASTASASTRPALGQELGEIAAATVRLASEIRPLLNDEAAATLDKLVHDGEDDACRIAVIGQAKAGKSALINALIRRPGLLPTDTNPSPVALTNLHFGRRSDRRAAGEPSEHSQSTPGECPDFTKPGDVYVDLPPFAYATTIVDTPGMREGTDGPSPAGEAPSREALESTDAYIVVLNAQQALSSGDVSLLRLLQGVQKSRLVVFVNRIDALSNPALDKEVAVAQIRDKLAAEFPGVAIPVVAGSALRLSGLDELKTILSRLVLQGPAMLRLQRRQRALYEMALNTEIAARGELRSLEQQIAAAREGEGATASHWAQEAEDLKRFNTLPTAIMEQIKAAAQSFDQLKGLAVPRLDAALREVARRHVSQARRLLLAQPRFIRHEHVWQHDTQPLRRDLEREFQAIHQDVAEQFRQVERAASAEIFEMVCDLIPENPLITEDVRSPLIDPAPSISALGETVAIELDEQWQAWWRLWHGPRQRAHTLEERLSAELNATVDKLLQAADAELEAYIVTAVQRYSQLVRDVATTLDRRKFELDARRHNAAEKPLNGAKPDAVIADYPARLKRQTQRIKESTRIAAELKQLVRQCAAFGQ